MLNYSPSQPLYSNIDCKAIKPCRFLSMLSCGQPCPCLSCMRSDTQATMRRCVVTTSLPKLYAVLVCVCACACVSVCIAIISDSSNSAACQDKFTLPPGCGLCTSLASFSLLNINTDKLTHTQECTQLHFPHNLFSFSPLSQTHINSPPSFMAQIKPFTDTVAAIAESGMHNIFTVSAVK